MTSRCAAFFVVAFLAGCYVGPSLGLEANRVAQVPAAIKFPKIHHVVIIFQENRTVDDLFNGLPGADTVRSGFNSSGHRVPLRPISLTAPYDLGHLHHAFLVEYNNGRWNGFDKVGSECVSVGICPPANVRAYGFVPHGEIQPYLIMAGRYTFGDRMFQTNQGPSFPAHQYIVSGTSSITNSNSLKASENGSTPAGGATGGCDSPPGSLVVLIDSLGNEVQNVYPCFDRISLMQLVEAKSLTWRYYQGAAGPGIWNGPDAILRIRESPSYSANVATPPSQVLTDIAQGHLADVVWVTPTGRASDHARSTDGSGPSWVADVVNAIGQSNYWKDTAIFVTWDDWGGWFDHVAPHLYNSYELSFRVPLIVVSPYAKNAYVSHKQHEFGSLLKFTEEAFGLGSLHTTDVRSDDLSDCFDFSKPPTKFKHIPTRLPPEYFLRQPASNVIPDDD
ncbi:MAG TPA: alkaline phosphatase family protein [Candidatus Cybelea sp.]